METTTSVIIPIYLDRIDLYPIIDRCIKSYVLSDDRELILIDDCSPYPCEDWPITFRNPVNLGYTGTVNKGFDLAKGKNIWVINDDIEFNSEILEKLNTIKDDTIYLPKWANEPFDAHNKFGFFWGLTRNTLDKIGKLDPQFTHYFSDLDMWKRVNQMGIEIIKWDIEVFHYSGATYRGNSELFTQDMEKYRKKWGQVD